MDEINMGKREVKFIRKMAKGLCYTVNDKIKSGGPGRTYRVGISLEELFQMTRLPECGLRM